MVVLLKDALQMMEAKNPETGEYLPFDFGYCTYSRQRDEGGKLIDYKGVKLTSNIVDEQAKKEAAPIDPNLRDGIVEVKNTNPFHRKNKTRNIQLANGEIRKLNFLFITSLNNQPVVY